MEDFDQLSYLVGSYWLRKVQSRLWDSTPGVVARQLRKQGVPFEVAYALIFNRFPQRKDD